MNFDPNKQNKPNFIWATYIPYRKPKFKAYSKRGPAINSLYHTYKYSDKTCKTKIIPEDVKLYKFVDGLWVEVEFTRVLVGKERIKINEH